MRHSAAKVLRRLTAVYHANELFPFLYQTEKAHFCLEDQRSETPCISLRRCQGSLNILGNVAAGDFRNCVLPVPLRHFCVGMRREIGTFMFCPHPKMPVLSSFIGICAFAETYRNRLAFDIGIVSSYHAFSGISTQTAFIRAHFLYPAPAHFHAAKYCRCSA